MDSVEKVAVPVLLLQAASTVFAWTVNSLDPISLKIFALFLGADLLGFGLIAHVWMSSRTGVPTSVWTALAWGLAVAALFIAGFVI